MQILIEGRSAEPEERTRSAMLLQKQALSAEWQVKIGYSRFKDDDRTFKTGAKAGETIEGKIVDQVWVQGIKHGNVFTVTWLNNKLDNVLWNRTITSIKELKELL